jgi:hypothetical protein
MWAAPINRSADASLGETNPTRCFAATPGRWARAINAKLISKANQTTSSDGCTALNIANTRDANSPI